MSTPSSYAYGSTPAPSGPPRKGGLRRAGFWMFIVGLVLSLLALGAVLWGGSQAFRVYDELSGNLTAVEGPTTVPMEANSLRMVLTPPGETPECTIAAPDGTTTPMEVDPSLNDLSGDGSDYRVAGIFTATQSGDHVVECSGGEAALTGPIDASALGGVAVAAVGFLALIPLGLLTLLGLILWLVGRSKDKRATQQPVGGYGYPGQGGYPSSTGYPGSGSGSTGNGPAYPPPPGQGHDGQSYGGQSYGGQSYGGQSYGGQSYGGQNPSYPPPSGAPTGNPDDPYAAPPPPPPGYGQRPDEGSR